ncbi:hypothetical protein NL676_005331 [Syzygium grande]|nr:hypothetical protein NL676_005331 [Syzygium grande]
MSSSESEIQAFDVLSDLDLDDLVDSPRCSDPDDVLEIMSDRADEERHPGLEAEHDDRPVRPPEPSAPSPSSQVAGLTCGGAEIIGIDSDSGWDSEYLDSVASGSQLDVGEESDWEEAMEGAVGGIEQAMASPEREEPSRDPDRDLSFSFPPEVAQQILRNEIARRGDSPASARVVEDLPLITVGKEGLGTGDGVCAVCKDMFVEGEKVKVLPCVHRYHQDCILPWLRMQNTCPVCRFGLPKEDLRLGMRGIRRDGGMDGRGLQ